LASRIQNNSKKFTVFLAPPVIPRILSALLAVVGGGAMFAGEVFIEQVLRDVAGIGLDKPGLGRPGELE